MSAARPTDTIRDAFDAMLWFLACLIGPLRPRKITPAEEIGALAACEVETDFEPDEPPAPLLALRDLVTRAAEEHAHPLRIVYAGVDWTPERIREALARRDAIGEGLAAAAEHLAGEDDPALADLCAAVNLASEAHAREDLPAALAEIERQARAAIVLTADAAALRSELAAAREEIERLNRLVVATANADPSWVERCTTQADEIERLTAELAAHAPADASLEEKKVSPIEFVAREFDRAAFMQERGFIDHDRGDCYRDAAKRMRAVDASRPGGTMSPDWIRGVRAAADVAASYNRDSTHPYRLDDCILAKLNVGGEPRANEHASRPGLTEGGAHRCPLRDCTVPHVHEPTGETHGLTEEQARAIVDDLNEAGDSPTVLVSAAAVRAMLDSRPASAVAKPDDRTLTEEQIDNVLRVALDVGKWDRPQGERMLRRFLRASRGETGPAADPRATPHAGDPARCPGPNCKMCNGEACNKCGAGCWNNAAPYCAHGVDERHEPANGAKRPQ